MSVKDDAAQGAAPSIDAMVPGAVALLRRLTGPHGIQASGAAGATVEYHAVFTRDAIMAGIAGLVAGDATVAEGLGRTLDTLAAHLGPEGQVPSNVRVLAGGGSHVSFGSLAPRLDGAPWFLVGAALAVRHGVRPAAALEAPVRRIVRLLDALEYNGRHLLYVPTGGNWADEYVTEGWTLSDQALRAWGMALCGRAFGEPAWSAKAAAIGGAVAERFATEPGGPGWPAAAVTPTATRRTLDLAGCALLALSGVATPMADAALDAIHARFLGAGQLPPAFHPVIHEGDPDWPALRRYHLHAFRNQPHEYHNGGIWPVWLGWLAAALGARGRSAALAALRDQAARAMAAPGFTHHEFLHGATLAPLGNPDMAYTATGIVLLSAAGTAAQARILD